MAIAKKKSHKGKRHPVHAKSFVAVAAEIAKAAQSKHADLLTPSEILALLANIFEAEGKRVQKIVR